MSKLTLKINEALDVLVELRSHVELLERDLQLTQQQNLDLRRRLKQLQPIGRSEQ